MYCIRNERNMRFHTVAAFYVILFSSFFNLSRGSFLILMLTISAVMTAEMVNTAIERISDIIASDYNLLARIVKDLAAGAVMLSAIFSVVIGIITFSDLRAYKRILEYFVNYPIMLLMLVISIVLSVIYINIGPKGIKDRLKFLKLKRK